MSKKGCFSISAFVLPIRKLPGGIHTNFMPMLLVKCFGGALCGRSFAQVTNPLPRITTRARQKGRVMVGCPLRNDSRFQGGNPCRNSWPRTAGRPPVRPGHSTARTGPDHPCSGFVAAGGVPPAARLARGARVVASPVSPPRPPGVQGVKVVLDAWLEGADRRGRNRPTGACFG